ncbi:MAG: hypothetical protein A3H35_04150 [Betaproteobacteria bacterium RIFCSPLOWO2_02_FULL_62_17]|nr:MAG: hypothetical protein A3H35_04150 [Betaproteobacteria bacterium RIFCSPLOWO2_02_FULL_62_17]
MIVCFECPDDRKREMDELIAKGGYRDYSEFISLAIANQFLLHSRAGIVAGIVVESASASSRERQANSKSGSSGSLNNESKDGSEIERPILGDVPEVFRAPKMLSADVRLASIPEDFFVLGEDIPLERWLFGQFNRLLPAKASCRAIANMLPTHTEGLELGKAAVEIARQARNLAIELQRRDSLLSTDRDDQLSTALPSPSSAEKGIARYSSQFVGGMNKRGQLSGLLASLKLIGRCEGKKSTISLTEAGWSFALLQNPCLDGTDGRTADKFSDEEREFLCSLIHNAVPQERSAYKTIIELIGQGHNTPENLDVALQKHVSPNFNASQSFIATQRSGAISRMTDLGLVARERDGIRVKYVVTERGKQFLGKMHHE